MPQIVKPYQYTNGQLIDANQLDANLDTLYAAINGNLDGSNLKTGLNVDINGVIDVKSPAYNASGSALATTGSITSGSFILTLTAALDFVNGQGISIAGAGVAGATLVTSIANGAGTTQLTLNTAASTTVTSVAVTHEDTVAIQAAVNQAITTGKNEVVLPRGTYNYGSLTNTGSITFVGDGVTLNGTTTLNLTSINALFRKTSSVINVMNYNASGLATTAIGSITTGTKALTLTTTPDFLTGHGINLQGVKEAASLQITGAATASANVSIVLAGVTYGVAVVTGDTAIQVATKIRAASFTGWVVGGTAGTDTVTFTAVATGVRSDSTYSAGTTGATGTMTTTTQGAEDQFSTVSSVNGLVVTIADNALRTITAGTISHDDTDALNAAFAAAGTNGGGTVIAPVGTYNIRYKSVGTIFAIGGSVSIPSNVHFIAFGAKFQMITTYQPKYNMFYLNKSENVVIEGGEIIGDTLTHDFSGGGTHEYGYGIYVFAAKNIEIRSCKIHHMTGDSILISNQWQDNTPSPTTVVDYSNDISIHHCELYSNRRQGISDIGGNRHHIYKNYIHDISGTAPQFGIDVEPSYDSVNGCDIEDNWFVNNAGGDIQVYAVNSNNTVINDIVIKGNKITKKLYLYNQPTTNYRIKIHDNTFNNPNSTGVGTDSSAYLQGNNVNFYDNSVYGAVTLNLIDSEVRDNKVIGGIVISSSSRMKMLNTIFRKDAITRTAPIYITYMNDGKIDGLDTDGFIHIEQADNTFKLHMNNITVRDFSGYAMYARWGTTLITNLTIRERVATNSLPAVAIGWNVTINNLTVQNCPDTGGYPLFTLINATSQAKLYINGGRIFDGGNTLFNTLSDTLSASIFEMTNVEVRNVGLIQPLGATTVKLIANTFIYTSATVAIKTDGTTTNAQIVDNILIKGTITTKAGDTSTGNTLVP